MNWEEKIKMIIHLNKGEYDQGTDVLLENIDVIDGQAIDMFITGLELSNEVLSKSIDKHRLIIERIKELTFENFRVAMRISLYEELVSKL